MKGNLWAFVVVVILGALLLPAAGIAYEDSTIFEVEDENQTLSDDFVPLDEANEADRCFDETVTHPEDGTLVESEDYEIDEDECAIRSDSNDYENEDVVIDYRFSSETDTTAAVNGVLGETEVLYPVLVLVVGVATLLGWINGFGGGR